MPTDFFVEFHDEASAEYDAAFGIWSGARMLPSNLTPK
jgi:hypothetical protein